MTNPFSLAGAADAGGGGARSGGAGSRAWLAAVAPALVLLLGVGGTSAVQPAGHLTLRAPLEEFPDRVGGYAAAGDERLSRAELRVLRPDDYLLRKYRGVGGGEMSLFVSFYGRQLSGATIHSPRNCLPGSGWKPLEHSRVPVATPYGDGSVNRYVVEHESGARALVFYWYQGRGRVAASEYAVKWHLVRDGLLRRRTDEALVRLVFPLGRDPAPPTEAAREAVAEVSRALHAHLPS